MGVYCIFSFHRGNTRMCERGIFINVLFTEIIFTFIFPFNLLTNYPPPSPPPSLLHQEEKEDIKDEVNEEGGDDEEYEEYE